MHLYDNCFIFTDDYQFLILQHHRDWCLHFNCLWWYLKSSAVLESWRQWENRNGDMSKTLLDLILGEDFETSFDWFRENTITKIIPPDGLLNLNVQYCSIPHLFLQNILTFTVFLKGDFFPLRPSQCEFFLTPNIQIYIYIYICSRISC